jgi:hypothetical protein
MLAEACSLFLLLLCAPQSCLIGHGRAGAPEAPALDLVLLMCLQCFRWKHHVSVGVCSNACMLVGGEQLGTHSVCMFSTSFFTIVWHTIRFAL